MRYFKQELVSCDSTTPLMNVTSVFPYNAWVQGLSSWALVGPDRGYEDPIPVPQCGYCGTLFEGNEVSCKKCGGPRGLD